MKKIVHSMKYTLPLFAAVLWTGPACFSSNPNSLEQDSNTRTSGADGSTGPSASVSESGSETGSVSSGQQGTATEATSMEATGAVDTSASSTSPGSGGVGCLGSCLAETPTGWDGPGLVLDVEFEQSGVECPGGTEESAVEAFLGLTADGASCGCGCGDAVDVSCGSTSLEFHGSDSGCSSPEAAYTVTWQGNGGSCVDIPGSSANRYWRAEPVTLSGGSCDPLPTSVISRVSWDSRRDVCEVSQSAARCVGGGVCVSDSSEFSTACIWRTGDHACEFEDYPRKALRYSSYVDSRACSECVCSEPVGECAGEVWLRNGSGCSGTSDRIDSDGGCHLVDVAAESAHIPVAAQACTPDGGPGDCQTVVSAACEASGGQAVGEVVETQPITFCCDR